MYDSGFPFYCIYTNQGTHPGNVNLCTTLVELYQEDSPPPTPLPVMQCHLVMMYQEISFQETADIK